MIFIGDIGVERGNENNFNSGFLKNKKGMEEIWKEVII